MKFVIFIAFIILGHLVDPEEARPQLDCVQDKNNKLNHSCDVDIGNKKLEEFVQEFAEVLRRPYNTQKLDFGFKARDLSYLKIHRK